MKEQIENGISKPVPDKPSEETIHYIPYQPVVRKGAESTKLRIVSDSLASPNTNTPLLYKCQEIGPSLQPKLFDIMLRNRFRLYAIIGDVQKACL